MDLRAALQVTIVFLTVATWPWSVLADSNPTIICPSIRVAAVNVYTTDGGFRPYVGGLSSGIFIADGQNENLPSISGLKTLLADIYVPVATIHPPSGVLLLLDRT
jgi:hypothetical protein